MDEQKYAMNRHDVAAASLGRRLTEAEQRITSLQEQLAGITGGKVDPDDCVPSAGGAELVGVNFVGIADYRAAAVRVWEEWAEHQATLAFPLALNKAMEQLRAALDAEPPPGRELELLRKLATYCRRIDYGGRVGDFEQLRMAPGDYNAICLILTALGQLDSEDR